MAGSCCGTVIGGTLADSISFKTVFIIGAMLTALCIPLIKSCSLEEHKDDNPINIFGFVKRIFKEKSLLIHLTALVLPCFGAGVFITYSVPYFGAKNNLPINVISALIMLNMLLVAYFTPYAIKLSSGFSIKIKSTFYGLLTSASLLLFCFLPNITGLIISIIMLGIADSFGLFALFDGFSGLSSSRTGNPLYNMIIFTLFGKAGQLIALQTFAITGGLPVILAALTAGGALIYLVYQNYEGIKNNEH
jgi:MFS family permease